MNNQTNIQPPKKMGRPQKSIDKEVFEELCEMWCTEEEIAHFFDDCSVDTINRWCKRTYKNDHGEPMTFAEVYKKYSAAGNISLRRQMKKLVDKGDRAMIIFLAKSVLGLHEEVTVNLGNDGVDLQIILPDNGR